MKGIVILEGKTAFTTTLIIAEGVKRKHKAVMELTREYESDLNDIGTAPIETRRLKTKGAPLTYAILDDSQATFLILLMRNSRTDRTIIEFKKKLTKEFKRQTGIIAQLIAQQKDPDWQHLRKTGKEVYFQKTDVIKEFVEYAIAQGSKSAKMYYMNLAKMENKALFIFEQKYENLREVMTIKQLMLVGTADHLIEDALKEGMDRGLPYKECFQLAKERIIAFAGIIGTSPILSLEKK